MSDVAIRLGHFAIALIATAISHVASADYHCIEDGGTDLCVKPLTTPWTYSLANSCADLYSGCRANLCAAVGGQYISLDCRNAPALSDEDLKGAATSYAIASGCLAVTDSGWGQPGGGEGYAGLTTVNGVVVFDQRDFEPVQCQHEGLPGTIVGLRSRSFYCPAGTSSAYSGSHGPEKCAKPIADCCSIPPLGDPISPATGESTQVVTDYSSGLLSLKRWYHSYAEALPLGYGGKDPKPSNDMFGANWRSEYATFLYPVSGSTMVAAVITRANGEIQVYRPDGTPVLPVGNNQTKLEILSNGYRLRNGGQMEVFDATGNLVSITDTAGRTCTLTYSSGGLLTSVADDKGRLLTFSYDPATNRVTTVTDPTGGLYQFLYDGNGNLASVTYPDNSSVQYLYENSAFVHALTGIVDENDSRFASITYNTQGSAIEAKHAGDVDKFDFSISGGMATVTDPLGTSRLYQQKTVLGVTKGSVVSEPSGVAGSNYSNGFAYDTNGNVLVRADFAGHITCYAYDPTRNLEIKRIEGMVGNVLYNSCTSALNSLPAPTTSSPVRAINRTWHPDWSLETQRAEPKKLTTWIYNGQPDPSNGNTVLTCAPSGALLPDGKAIAVLCKKVEQATTDETGALGFSATATGTPRISTYTYNRYGQVLTEDGPRTDVNDVTTYSYYPDTTATHTLGDLATVTDALGHVTQITAYDPNGRPLTVIDANGITLTFTYYPRGWLKTSSVAGQTTTYGYDNVGQLTSLTRPDNSQISYHYDPAHRLTSVSDLKGNSLTYTLDNAGNVKATTWTNPDGSTAKATAADYDALGRLYHAIDTRAAVQYLTTYGYDANGNPTTVTTPKNKTSTTTYDALNRPYQVTDTLNGLTTLAYDGQDQLSQFTAPNNAQTNFTADGLGNVTAETSPDRGNLTASYDAAGNLLTLQDARGVIESHTYDALNRPLTITYPQTGENLAYTWDTGCTNGVGRLCQVSDALGSTSYSYDARGNVLTETRTIAGVAFTSQYGYDGADRRLTLIPPTGKVLTTARDADGRIDKVATAVGSNPQANLVADIQTDAAGNTTTQRFGNGITESKTFHTDGLPATQAEAATSSGGTDDGDVPTLPEWAAILLGAGLLVVGRRQSRGSRTLLGLALMIVFAPIFITNAFADEALTYDANGNVQTRTLSGGTTSFGYDDLDRVTSESGPAMTQNLTYDANGNRKTDASGTTTYTANTDRVATINGVTVVVDPAGHITSARGYTYAWNQAGQLKTVSLGSTLLATYTYDYKGRRGRKVTTASAPQGAGTVLYHYDLDDHLIAETTAQGAVIATYVWRDDIPVAIILPGPPESVLYLEVDHLNTPIAARNQLGQVVWTWQPDAFGIAQPNQDPGNTGSFTTINLRFPGQYYDRESGLHYNWHRYFDPGLGRYLSPDPLGLEAGINPYLYGNANPLRYTDPTGLSSDDPLGGGTTSPPVGIPNPSAQAQQQLAQQLTQMLNQLKEKMCPTNTCPPGTPYAAGTIGYIGPHADHDHWPIGRPHLNLFQVNQNTSTCKCFWNKLTNAAAPPPLPGWVDLNGGFPPLSP